MWKAFTVETRDHVAEVTLIGPGKGNAMGPEFWDELPQIFRELDRDPDVRAVVLAGSGKHFSFGLDLKAMGDLITPLVGPTNVMARPRAEFHDQIKSMQASITSVAQCRKPVVAAVQGWCIGGGVDLITAVDIRYASAEAQFSVREARMAIVADVGSLQRLPAIIGDGHLRELAFTGKDIDARRAEKIGLVNDVFATPEETLDAARATAREIAANPPLAVHGAKDVLNQQRASAVADSLNYVAAWNAAFFASHDLVEAVSSLFEKREPNFRGE